MDFLELEDGERTRVEFPGPVEQRFDSKPLDIQEISFSMWHYGLFDSGELDDWGMKKHESCIFVLLLHGLYHDL